MVCFSDFHIILSDIVIWHCGRFRILMTLRVWQVKGSNHFFAFCELWQCWILSNRPIFAEAPSFVQDPLWVVMRGTYGILDTSKVSTSWSQRWLWQGVPSRRFISPSQGGVGCHDGFRSCPKNPRCNKWQQRNRALIFFGWAQESPQKQWQEVIFRCAQALLFRPGTFFSGA